MRSIAELNYLLYFLQPRPNRANQALETKIRRFSLHEALKSRISG